jgi:hypothetical protein
MPTLSKLLEKFKLYQGRTINNYKLISVTGEEDKIVQYRQYEYHVDLLFTGPTDVSSQDQLLDTLQQQLFTPMIIYTSYHNPYSCKFVSLSVDNVDEKNNTVMIHAVAESDRVFL